MSKARAVGAGAKAPQWPSDQAPAVNGAVYLQPGQHLIATAPTAVTTVLGSCVAVCVWDERNGFGGINHYLLPHWYGAPSSRWRFGNAAVDGLIDGLLRLGSPVGALRAKVFGGGRLLSAPRPSGEDLGGQNVAVALAILADRGIPVTARSVGGARGRKVVFHTHDGSAWVKTLRSGRD